MLVGVIVSVVVLLGRLDGVEEPLDVVGLTADQPHLERCLVAVGIDVVVLPRKDTVDLVAIDLDVVGTVEYGAAVLGSPLVVVMGHQRCGAVAAACDTAIKNATFPGSIGQMIEPIVERTLLLAVLNR